MTTRINVNVDQQALLQRSQEQTQANRLAFLEGQNRSRAGKEAERQREASGLSADGSTYNNRLRQLPQRPDPAAWRTGRAFRVGHSWLLYLGEDTPANEAYKDKYRIYSGDLSKSLDFTLERAKPPEPALKWGLQSYNVTIGHDFANAEWQSGYQVSPSDPLKIHGFGYLKNKDQYNPIRRSHFLGLEKVVSHLRNYSTSPISRVVSNDPLIEQNAQWWATAPQIEGITDRFTTRMRRKSIYDYRQLALPVGDGLMLVLITSSSYESAHYYGQRIKRLCGASSENLTFVKDFGDNTRTPEDLYDPDEPMFGGSVVFWYGTYKYGGYREKDELIDSFDETHINERRTTKCFLVSLSTVKEVAMPTKLADELAKRYPFTQVFPSYPKTLDGLSEFERGLQYIFSTTNQGWIDQYWIAEEQAYSYWPPMGDIIVYTGQPSYSPQILTYNFNSYTPPAPPTNELQSQSYGFDNLDNSRNQDLPSYTDAYTPGVFTLLNIKNTVLPPVTLDTSYYTVDSGSSAAWMFDYRYAMGLPENQPPENVRLLPNSAPKIRVQKSTVSALDTSNGWPTLFRTWDWDKPSYCEQILISLGFSKSDLTP